MIALPELPLSSHLKRADMCSGSATMEESHEADMLSSRSRSDGSMRASPLADQEPDRIAHRPHSPTARFLVDETNRWERFVRASAARVDRAGAAIE